MAATNEVTVTAVNIFPIKSCHALQVQEAKIGPYGVHGDRRFMLVDGSSNRFISQRKFPKLAKVHCKMEVDNQGKEVMHVSAPGMEKELTFSPVVEGDRIKVGIWDEEVMVVDQGEEPAQWFSEFIGHGGNFSRLVASAETSVDEKSQREGYHRPVANLPVSLKQRLSEMQLALADVGPVSLASQESLADVNVRLNERGCDSVLLNRFRMNIEVSGCCKPFEEDEWFVVKIGEVPFMVYRNAEVSVIIYDPKV